VHILSVWVWKLETREGICGFVGKFGDLVETSGSIPGVGYSGVAGLGRLLTRAALLRGHREIKEHAARRRLNRVAVPLAESGTPTLRAEV